MTRLRFNKEQPQLVNSKQQQRNRILSSTVNNCNKKLILTNNSIRSNSKKAATSLPIISSTICCSQSTTNQAIQLTANQTDERKLQSNKNSIRLINGSIGTLRVADTLRRSPNEQLLNSIRTDYSLVSNNNNLITSNDEDTNSLFYKRMLSYSTNSLEPSIKYQQAKQQQQQEMNKKSYLNNRFNLNNFDKSSYLSKIEKNSLRIKEKDNEMMRLIGTTKHTDTCSESCCEIRTAKELLPKLPKIKLNRTRMMQSSLNNCTGFLRKQSIFSKSLDSLVNLHLYESLEKMNKQHSNRLQHRISRKRTLNHIFPQINLNDKDNLEETNEDLLNNDLDDLDDELNDDLNEDIDLNEFDLDDLNDELNDNFNDDEIEFKFSLNQDSFIDSSLINLDNLDNQKQFTTKIVLKKQPKIRQQKPAKLVNDSIVKNQLNDQFLIKSNNLTNGYVSESSD